MNEREYPSLFDADDAALGLVDRSAWVVDSGGIRVVTDQGEAENP